MDVSKILDSILKRLNGGINVTLENGDIEIGAVEIKNGTTDTRATVTAASTAAQATDTSVVVALNPNTPIPVGTNSIGNISVLSTLTSGNVGGFTAYVSSTITMSVAGAYATGDYMGTTTTPQSFASCVRTSGGTGVINSITISDKITNANVAMELWLFSATFVAPTDNAAWTISDTEMLTVLGVIPIITSKWYASGANQIYFDDTISMVVKPAATSIFYALVARGTTPAFTSLDLTLNLGILQD